MASAVPEPGNMESIMTKRWSSIRGGSRAGGWTWTKRYASKIARRRGRATLAAVLALSLSGCAMFSVPGSVDYTGANGTRVSSTGGAAELEVTDVPNGCHNWRGQGSITLMDVNIACTYTPSTGQFSKTLSVKSADPIQELIEANKNQQAITNQALQALTAIVGALMPKPVP